MKHLVLVPGLEKPPVNIYDEEQGIPHDFREELLPYDH
jgi:hypothetical protein